MGVGWSPLIGKLLICPSSLPLFPLSPYPLSSPPPLNPPYRSCTITRVVRLSGLRKSNLFPRGVRKIISKFAVVIALVVTVFIDLVIMNDVESPKLDIPEGGMGSCERGREGVLVSVVFWVDLPVFVSG